jgi:hypothetical protein
MPAQHRKRRTGLPTPRTQSLPEPGIGGYDYPRGPFGATGFPGSTPASSRTKTEARPEGARGLRQLDVAENQAEWAALPTRRPDGSPRQPRARLRRTMESEQRMTPVIGANAPGSQNVRNQVAQRFKAIPGMVREYQPARNPGKNGDRAGGPSQYHPGVTIHGEPDGKPIPGMDANPGAPPSVMVPSRYVSLEGGMEGYAMNRRMAFTKGGTPAPYPPGYQGNEHIRGARLTGQRYFGALSAQQEIGLPSDSYGIARARGPRHRPVRFEMPPPWAANYYDVPPEQEGPADMIRKSPHRPRAAAGRPRRG